MAVVLFRVDDRLAHGQVTAGWGRVLSPARIVIISDPIAGSSWETALYRTAIPQGVEFEVLTVEQALEKFPTYTEGREKVFILVENIETVSRLVEGGLVLDKVNLGGIHHDRGREEILPYIYLSPLDRERLIELKEKGIDLIAQDVPSGKGIDIVMHLKKYEGSR